MSAQAKKVTVDNSVNNLIITSTFLKKHHACEDGIKFFERNFSELLFPKGLNLLNIKVTGDYNYYFYWIKKLTESKFEYDNEGNLIKIIFPDETFREYNSCGDIIKEKFSDGYIQKWKYKYNDNGIKIKETFPAGYIEEFNSHGDKIKETFPNGNVYEWKFEYDNNGNKTKTIFPDGYIEEYNFYGHLIKEISPDGIIEEWKFEYDENGNIVKETLFDGSIEEYIFKYDDKGRLIQIDKCYIEYLE